MGKKFKSKRKAKLASDSTVMMMNSDIPVMNSSKRKLGKSDVVNLSNVAATAEVLDSNHDNDTEDVPENWSERINDDDEDDVEDDGGLPPERGVWDNRVEETKQTNLITRSPLLLLLLDSLLFCILYLLFCVLQYLLCNL